MSSERPHLSPPGSGGVVAAQGQRQEAADPRPKKVAGGASHRLPSSRSLPRGRDAAEDSFNRARAPRAEWSGRGWDGRDVTESKGWMRRRPGRMPVVHGAPRGRASWMEFTEGRRPENGGAAGPRFPGLAGRASQGPRPGRERVGDRTRRSARWRGGGTLGGAGGTLLEARTGAERLEARRQRIEATASPHTGSPGKCVSRASQVRSSGAWLRGCARSPATDPVFFRDLWGLPRTFVDRTSAPTG